VGSDAVKEGIIDDVGGIREALAKLYSMIGEKQNEGNQNEGNQNQGNQNQVNPK